MAAIVKKIDKGLQCFEKPMMFITGTALFALMVWAVAARFIFAIPTAYQPELAQLLHLWLCFMGGSYLISINGHPFVEIFPDKVIKSRNVPFKKVYFTLIYLLTLFFIVPCFYYGVKQIPLYMKQVTIYLQINYIWVYGGGILGFGMMIFRTLLRIVGIWSGLYIGEDDVQNQKELEGGASV